MADDRSQSAKEPGAGFTEEITVRVHVDPEGRHEGAHGGRPTMKLPRAAVSGAAPRLDSGALGLDPRHDTPPTLVVPASPPPDRATITVLAGDTAGQSFALEGTETLLGRSPDATIPIDDVAVSRHHARIVREGDGRYAIEDLGSTNGTFVGARRVLKEALCTGDRVQLGPHCVLRFALVDEGEVLLQRRLYESASRDTLTGLANRRTLFERLAAAIAHAQRSGEEIALLMIDIDHFKRVNDAFGHLVGDQVLCALATASERVLRAGDVLARYGGEELTVLARETSLADATTLAERLRGRVKELRVDAGGASVGVTVSIGVSVLSECGPSNDATAELLARADARLYAAKLAGRDRVCAADP